MNRFEIGQDIICIKNKTWDDGTSIKKNQIYHVKSIFCCCTPYVDIGVRLDEIYNIRCQLCKGFIGKIKTDWIGERYFAPIGTHENNENWYESIVKELDILSPVLEPETL